MSCGCRFPASALWTQRRQQQQPANRAIYVTLHLSLTRSAREFSILHLLRVCRLKWTSFCDHPPANLTNCSKPHHHECQTERNHGDSQTYKEISNWIRTPIQCHTHTLIHIKCPYRLRMHGHTRLRIRLSQPLFLMQLRPCLVQILATLA
jgi:hypothetical protein